MPSVATKETLGGVLFSRRKINSPSYRATTQQPELGSLATFS